jgi:hypothetical protein
MPIIEDDVPDVTFTLTPQQATDVVVLVPHIDPNHDGLPTVFYVLNEQYIAQGGGT